MMIRAMVAGLSVLAVAVVADTAHAASTSPGKIAVYASTAAAVITTPPATVLTATIAKGRKKRVLEVELTATATAQSGPGDVTSGILSVVPVVNGLTIMEPANAGSTVPGSTLCGSGPIGCSVSFEFWLDLDAAEAAHPGVFIKQPLVIEGQVDWSLPSSPATPVSGFVSLRARLQKK